jgi:hypothetical protein
MNRNKNTRISYFTGGFLCKDIFILKYIYLNRYSLKKYIWNCSGILFEHGPIKLTIIYMIHALIIQYKTKKLLAFNLT